MFDTYVVIASGPSLTKEQVEQIHKYKKTVCVVAVNDNYKLAPWADYIFAADIKWWSLHYSAVCKTVSETTQLRTLDRTTKVFFRRNEFIRKLESNGEFKDVTMLDTNPNELFHGGCSGILAIEFIRTLNNRPKKIILVGFDMQHTNDKTHWFGDHPKGFINANACERWRTEIESMLPYYKKLGIELVNCSIDTALTCVRKSKLEEEL